MAGKKGRDTRTFQEEEIIELGSERTEGSRWKGAGKIKDDLQVSGFGPGWVMVPMTKSGRHYKKVVSSGAERP